MLEKVQGHINMGSVVSHQRTEIAIVPDTDLATHGNGLPFAAL